MSTASRNPYLIKAQIAVTGLSDSYVANTENYGGTPGRAMDLSDISESAGGELASATLMISNVDHTISDNLKNQPYVNGTVTISFINEATGSTEYSVEFPVDSVSWDDFWANFYLKNLEL